MEPTTLKNDTEFKLLFILLIFCAVMIISCISYFLAELSPRMICGLHHQLWGYLRSYFQRMGNCCVKAYVDESDSHGGNIPNPLIIGLAGHLRHHFATRGRRDLEDLPPSYDNYSPPSYEECVVVVDDKLPIIC